MSNNCMQPGQDHSPHPEKPAASPKPSSRLKVNDPCSDRQVRTALESLAAFGG